MNGYAYRILDPDILPSVESRHLAEFRREEERLLLEDVDAFGHDMFSLPVPVRQDAWNQLLARSEHSPRACAWLEGMAAGLYVEPDEVDSDDEAASRLTQQLTRLFPLRSAARVMLRDEILRELKADSSVTPRDVRRLRSRYSAIAALDPPLLAALTTSPESEKKLVKARQRSASATVQRRRNSGSGISGWAIGLILMGLALMGRLTTMDGPRPSPSNYSPSSSFQGPSDEEMQKLLQDILKMREQSDQQQQAMPAEPTGAAEPSKLFNQLIREQIQGLSKSGHEEPDPEFADAISQPLPRDLIPDWPAADASDENETPTPETDPSNP